MKRDNSNFSINSYLDKIIRESLATRSSKKIIKEEEEKSNESDKLKSGEISSSDIVSKLNSIRAGRSFKEESIASALENYIKDLTKAEKTALFAFLKGISQIVTGEFPADKAVEPSDDPAKVDMEKSSGGGKVTIKPVIIKGQKKQEKKEKPPEEDASGPVPITPKK